MREAANPPISASRTFAGSAPAFFAKVSASATASMVRPTMIWLATLAVWPSPTPPMRVMFLPIFSNSGFARSNTVGLAADHDGQRGVLGADFAARHRGIEIVAAQRFDAPGEFLGRDRRDRAHVDDELALAQALGDAVLAEQHGLDVGRVGHHQDDDVRRLRRPPWPCPPPCRPCRPAAATPPSRG